MSKDNFMNLSLQNAENAYFLEVCGRILIQKWYQKCTIASFLYVLTKNSFPRIGIK